MKKSIIYGLMDEERNTFRKGFVRYLAQKYGVNPYTAYPKLKQGRFRIWEVKGIAECVAEFVRLNRESNGSEKEKYAGFIPLLEIELGGTMFVNNYYDSLRNKSDFVRYMETCCGMGMSTVRRRFSGFKFSEIEIKGWENVYREYLALGGAKWS